MNTLDPLAIILLAGLVHASFQLGISVMTVMSGHALGKKTAKTHVTSLSAWYSLGGALMIALSLSFLTIIVQNIAPHGIPAEYWGVISGLAIGIGVAIWAVYFRHRQGGTILWVPRPLADYLSSRARHTSVSVEAFNLGMTSIIAETLFSIAPLLVSAFILVSLPAPMQLAGLVLYVFVASLPLLCITVLIGGGHSTARIQRWRELNKRFLQFAAGSASIILGVYLYIDIVVSRITLGGS